MRTLALGATLMLGAANAAAQARSSAQAIGGTIGAYLEENYEVGDALQTRLPVPLVFSMGSPRKAQLDIEPAFGWFSKPGAATISGLSYSRLRFFWFFGSANRLSIGPDVEAYVKTERVLSLGYGYDRVMPGIQASWKIHGDFRTNFRVRYEYSVNEDSGVTKVRRVAVRPSIYFPKTHNLSTWLRSDILLDVHGAPTQYNVEGYAGLGVGPAHRLTLFVEPRLYVGAASRTKNLWRLRSGLNWSLGGLTVHRPPQSS